MITVTSGFNSAISASVRTVKAKVSLYNGATLVNSYTSDDKIISVEIQRVAEDNKFFGMCICQRVNIHLIDKERALNITTSHSLKVSFGVTVGNAVEYVYFPRFYVTEVNRNENTNELSITAYDLISKIEEHTVSEINLSSYTVNGFINAIATLMGTNIVKQNIGSGETCFSTSYPNGANYEGTETLKEALTHVAEISQTIVFINADGQIVFKRLPSASALSITRNDYIECKNSGNRRLQTISNATELGDNVSASTTITGTTQYVRNNPFWELREDIGDLVEAAIAAVGNQTIGVFDLAWRGHPALELGDKLTITAKDNSTFSSYLLDDIITYNGAYSQKTRWEYKDEEEETASNPSTLGDTIKQTYARVDKANRQIELVASQAAQNEEDISALKIGLDGISASVTSVRQELDEAVEGLSDDLASLTNTVEAKMSAEDVQLAISRTLENGVTSVTTTTGFTLNEEGLTVSKSDSDISTQITENGLHVRQDSTEVLVANDNGVDARNLHANTYLIIGQNSRFEDFNGKTACFWIGG